MSTAPVRAGIAALLEQYQRATRSAGPVRALRALRGDLATAPAADWLACARGLVARHAPEAALGLLESLAGPARESTGYTIALAEALGAVGDAARAEALLQPLLPQPAAALALAAVLRTQGRAHAAAAMLDTAAAQADAPTMLSYMGFLMESHQQAAALAICERALAAAPDHGPLNAMAGLLDLSLGDFAHGRERLLAALRAPDLDREAWLIAPSLAEAQRYSDANHPDLALFESLLARSPPESRERAALLFALAKANDDLGRIERAAALYREANERVRRVTPWSRERWNRWIELQLAWPPVVAPDPGPRADFTPVFVVGMPRSGTTLVTEILARHPEVRSRGELGLLPALRHWLAPPARSQNPVTVAAARRRLLAELRQDDADPVRWTIDKNPLNFRYLGVLAALAPEARVIYCRRNLRDTALSIWKQFFQQADAGYAYAFENMIDLFDSCAELMLQWQATIDLPILTVDYEQLVADPAAATARIAAFAGLPPADLLNAPARAGSAIGTASRWQARQPVYQRSVGAWRAYAPFVPELERFFPDASS